MIFSAFKLLVNNPNGEPLRRFVFSIYKSKEICYMTACEMAWRYAIEFQEDGYEIKLQQTETI